MSSYHDPWWDYARCAAAALRRGLPPPAVKVYGPVLGPDERALLTAPAQISRLTAGDGTYQHSSTFLWGSPMFTLGVMGTQGLINRRRRQRALHDAIPAWRLHREGTVLVTDERLIIPAANGTQLLSFWFANVSEFHVDLTQRTVELAYSTAECEPVRLHGPAVPGLALWAAVAIYGPDWINDDRLRVLLPTTHLPAGSPSASPYPAALAAGGQPALGPALSR